MRGPQAHAAASNVCASSLCAQAAAVSPISGLQAQVCLGLPMDQCHLQCAPACPQTVGEQSGAAQSANTTCGSKVPT